MDIERRRQAELAALRQVQHGIEPLAAFIRRRSPRLAPARHLAGVVQLFERSRHESVYATISMPPRMGKTTTVAHGIAWRTLYDPACLNFYATFGLGLSVASSRQIRRLSKAAGVPFAPDSKSVHDWRTLYDGGLKATSVGGDVTGRGCNGGVIVGDDLLKVGLPRIRGHRAYGASPS